MEKWDENDRNSNWDKIVEAVASTQVKIITYNNSPIDAFFHSNSGGITEVPVNVWGGTGYPYLQSVETSGENTYTQYRSYKFEVFNLPFTSLTTTAIIYSAI